MVSINDLLRALFDKNASDLHITAGAAPGLRIDGDISSFGTEKLSPEVCQELIYSVLTDDQKEKFERENELDLAFGVKGLGRIRMNVFRQRGAVAAVLRNIPSHIPTFEELGLPEMVSKTIVKLPKGLVLVTGPTGSGKSTTIASIIDYINADRKGHIITVEDPIEYVYSHKNCLVNQREIGTDSLSFTASLKHILRQDPDVIVIGEMRDLETIQAALTIAETGHLVLATLHTPDASQTIDRIIDVFPPHQQNQVRMQLSLSLQGVVSQQLLPRADGLGQIIATEVLRVNSAVRNIIRKGSTQDIYSIMEIGAKYGMQTMDNALKKLVADGLITKEAALERAVNQENLGKLLSK